MFAKGFTRKKRTLHCYAQCKILWATLHKARLAALYAICLQIFRYLAQKLLEIRKYSCVVSIQSNEKSDYASYAQSLCNVAHIYTKKVRSHKENALCKISIILFRISSSVQVQLSRLPYYMRHCSRGRLL